MTYGCSSNIRLTDMNNTSAREKSMQQNILGNYDSYIMDDKKKMYELERQVGYLIQDNK